MFKTDSTESRCVTGPENILFLRRVRDSFIPELLEAGAVKWLIEYLLDDHRIHRGTRPLAGYGK